jgi:hypothetical protein
MFFPAADWFSAFVLTLIVELPITVLLLRRVEFDLRRAAVLVVFANLATHLAVWYVFTQLFLVGTSAYVLVAEGWAVIAETVVYVAAFRGLAWRWALATALIANGASFVVGRAVGQLLPELVR